MKVLVCIDVSHARSYSHVFVAAAVVPVKLLLFYGFHFFVHSFRLLWATFYMCVCVCVSEQLISFLFALLALSHSRDVLKQPRGRWAYILLMAVEENRGRKWKVLPSFHTPATSHTDSATDHGKWESVRLCAYGNWVPTCGCLCIGLHTYVFCLLRITLHGYTNCLRSAVIFAQSAVEQCVLRVSEKHYSAAYRKGFDLSGPSHTRRLVQYNSSLPGRWRETQ